jgi:hypothetical protein
MRGGERHVCLCLNVALRGGPACLGLVNGLSVAVGVGHGSWGDHGEWKQLWGLNTWGPGPDGPLPGPCCTPFPLASISCLWSPSCDRPRATSGPPLPTMFRPHHLSGLPTPNPAVLGPVSLLAFLLGSDPGRGRTDTGSLESWPLPSQKTVSWSPKVIPYFLCLCAHPKDPLS